MMNNTKLVYKNIQNELKVCSTYKIYIIMNVSDLHLNMLLGFKVLKHSTKVRTTISQIKF